MNPRAMGAVFPSSKHLAQRMVASIETPGKGLIVELGAGTGVITEAILQAGILPEQVVAIEYLPHLAQKLRERFPKIEVIEGDAAQLIDLLKNKDYPVETIISSLPLRSLSKEVRKAILTQIPAVLSPEGRYVQFTYDVRRDKSYYPDNYCLMHSSIVWRNIPPAKVEVFSLGH